MTPAGKLNKRIAIEQSTTTTLPNGEPSEPVWTLFWPCWGGCRPASAKEMTRGEELGHVVTVTWTMRYKSGITSAMRVNLNGRIFQIHGIIDPEDAHVELRLLCQETT